MEAKVTVNSAYRDDEHVEIVLSQDDIDNVSIEITEPDVEEVTFIVIPLAALKTAVELTDIAYRRFK